jgi:hypothetical protein
MGYEYTASYDPQSGSVLASAGIALIPIAVLFALLLTTRAIVAAWVGLILVIVVAAG